MRIDLPNCGKLGVDIIDVSDRLRHLDENKVGEIAESMMAIGQINPIIVRDLDCDGARLILVAGHHRLAAAKRIGMKEVDVIVVEGEDVECRLWEIAENLHRADLTALERSEHIEEWRKLTAEKASQVATPSGGAQPAEAGVRKTAQELGIKKEEVSRSHKIASIMPEAKEAAKKAGLADNQSALLKVAAKAPEEQVAEVETIAARKAEARPAPAFNSRDRVIALANVIAWAGLGSNISEGAAPVVETIGLLSAWSTATEAERSDFMVNVGDHIVAALTPDQLRAAALLWKRMDEQVRRQARTPEEVERVKAADRARQSKSYAQKRRAA
jgi:ParB-like chromosome segregation protein Spo0J